MKLQLHPDYDIGLLDPNSSYLHQNNTLLGHAGTASHKHDMPLVADMT